MGETRGVEGEGWARVSITFLGSKYTRAPLSILLSAPLSAIPSAIPNAPQPLPGLSSEFLRTSLYTAVSTPFTFPIT